MYLYIHICVIMCIYLCMALTPYFMEVMLVVSLAVGFRACTNKAILQLTKKKRHAQAKQVRPGSGFRVPKP